MNALNWGGSGRKTRQIGGYMYKKPREIHEAGITTTVNALINQRRGHMLYEKMREYPPRPHALS